MRFSKPWLKTLASLFVNLAATWYAAALLIPTVAPVSLGILLYNLTTGTLYLLFSVDLERTLEDYDRLA